MNIIHSIFSLILKFRAQLISQPWDCQQGEAVHPSFIAMQQSYNTFKYYSHFLFTGEHARWTFLLGFRVGLLRVSLQTGSHVACGVSCYFQCLCEHFSPS